MHTFLITSDEERERKSDEYIDKIELVSNISYEILIPLPAVRFISMCRHFRLPIFTFNHFNYVVIGHSRNLLNWIKIEFQMILWYKWTERKNIIDTIDTIQSFRLHFKTISFCPFCYAKVLHQTVDVTQSFNSNRKQIIWIFLFYLFWIRCKRWIVALKCGFCLSSESN